MHGARHTKAVNAGSCDSPDISVSDTPNTNSVNIALAKKAKIISAEQESVVHEYYHAKLAVINIGDTFTSGA
jgi:hypothetical protein